MSWNWKIACLKKNREASSFPVLPTLILEGIADACPDFSPGLHPERSWNEYTGEGMYYSE